MHGQASRGAQERMPFVNRQDTTNAGSQQAHTNHNMTSSPGKSNNTAKTRSYGLPPLCGRVQCSLGKWMNTNHQQKNPYGCLPILGYALGLVGLYILPLALVFLDEFMLGTFWLVRHFPNGKVVFHALYPWLV